MRYTARIKAEKGYLTAMHGCFPEEYLPFFPEIADNDNPLKAVTDYCVTGKCPEGVRSVVMEKLADITAAEAWLCS